MLGAPDPPLELLTPSEMASVDRATIAAGADGFALMENAGRAVAERVRDLWDGGRVLVLAGPGNNGGDGFVAARHLAAWGFDVELRLAGAPAHLAGDARRAAASFAGTVHPLASPRDCAGVGLVVDALFGAGLTRALDDNVVAVIEAVTALGLPVVAVDLPSGVDGRDGRIRNAAFRATATVTFGRAKPGHHMLPGALHVGCLHVIDIGLARDALAEAHAAPPGPLWANRPALWRAAWPASFPAAHKYHHGHAVVVAGGVATGGAGRLAARAALAYGAGLVTLAAPRGALTTHASRLDAVMVRPVTDHDLEPLLRDARRNAWLLGPGGGVGATLRAQVETVLATGRATVLDADALTSFEDDVDALRARVRGACVLTPHAGEAQRLGVGGADRVAAARDLARRSGAVVVLKGFDSVVAAPDGRAAIAVNGCARLATAGSGDVLAGMVLAGLARSMPAFEAAAMAVWVHNEAAHAAAGALTADDLPGLLPRTLLSSLQ
ncbi:MAG: NAD(P)H-hydrate dehydratase [Pseudomonadota bacterium]